MSSTAGRRVVAVSAGYQYSLAITADGAVWSWGDGSQGQLGHGDASIFYEEEEIQLLPKKIEVFGRRVVAVSAGLAHSFAVTADGSGKLPDAPIPGDGSAVEGDVPALVAEAMCSSDAGLVLNAKGPDLERWAKVWEVGNRSHCRSEARQPRQRRAAGVAQAEWASTSEAKVLLPVRADEARRLARRDRLGGNGLARRGWRGWRARARGRLGNRLRIGLGPAHVFDFFAAAREDTHVNREAASVAPNHHCRSVLVVKVEDDSCPAVESAVAVGLNPPQVNDVALGQRKFCDVAHLS